MLNRALSVGSETFHGPICSAAAGGSGTCIGNPIDHNAICGDLGMVYDATKKLCVPKPTTGGGTGSGTGSSSGGTGSGDSTGAPFTPGTIGSGTGSGTTPATTPAISSDTIKQIAIGLAVWWLAKEFLKA